MPSAAVEQSRFVGHLVEAHQLDADPVVVVVVLRAARAGRRRDGAVVGGEGAVEVAFGLAGVAGVVVGAQPDQARFQFARERGAQRWHLLDRRDVGHAHRRRQPLRERPQEGERFALVETGAQQVVGALHGFERPQATRRVAAQHRRRAACVASSCSRRRGPCGSPGRQAAWRPPGSARRAAGLVRALCGRARRRACRARPRRRRAPRRAPLGDDGVLFAFAVMPQAPTTDDPRGGFGLRSYVAVGHVTIDVLADGRRRPGGTALYSALQAARLGLARDDRNARTRGRAAGAARAVLRRARADRRAGAGDDDAADDRQRRAAAPADARLGRADRRDGARSAPAAAILHSGARRGRAVRAAGGRVALSRG